MTVIRINKTDSNDAKDPNGLLAQTKALEDQKDENHSIGGH